MLNGSKRYYNKCFDHRGEIASGERVCAITGCNRVCLPWYKCGEPMLAAAKCYEHRNTLLEGESVCISDGCTNVVRPWLNREGEMIPGVRCYTHRKVAVSDTNESNM